MKITLRDLLIPQPKSKIKAGNGETQGVYKFFTSSPIQNKFYDEATYDYPSLIFGTGGNASVHYCAEPFSTSTDCLVMYGTDKANLELIYQYLHTNLNILQAGFKGAGLQHISKDYILDIEIYLPDADVQNNIAKQMREIDAMVSYRNQQLFKYDDLVKSRFIELFGLLENPAKDFPRDVLKNLCTKITDGKHGGCTSEIGTGHYFVGAREIYDDTVHYDTAPEINLYEFEKDYKRCNVEIGDFLIVNTGATIGKSAIAVDPRTECTLLQKSVALLKVKRGLLNPVFLQYCYRVNDEMYKVDSASAQPNLLLSKINSTEIYVPPIDLQNQFAAFVEQTDKLKFEVKEALEKLEILKKSLMQKYFG